MFLKRFILSLNFNIFSAVLIPTPGSLAKSSTPALLIFIFSFGSSLPVNPVFLPDLRESVFSLKLIALNALSVFE
jgi:hypothetical protein